VHKVIFQYIWQLLGQVRIIALSDTLVRSEILQFEYIAPWNCTLKQTLQKSYSEEDKFGWGEVSSSTVIWWGHYLVIGHKHLSMGGLPELAEQYTRATQLDT